MQMVKQEHLMRVKEISLPGIYHSMGGKHPNVKYDDISFYLKGKYPHIFLQTFNEATLEDGEYTPASFSFDHKWKGHLDNPDGEYIGCDGEMYFLISGGSYSNGSGSWEFLIKDVGNLSIAKNKLIIDKPKLRDGKMDVYLSGSAPHHTNPPEHWKAHIEYEGRHPGKLVLAVRKYLNSEIARLNAPLLKK
jgi:hypothetical protein